MMRYLLFDLDDTLYPKSAGLMNEISQRMNEYLVTRLDVPVEQVTQVRQSYWERYGTTLRGLYIERQIDPKGFLDYVHAIEVSKYLLPDVRLGKMLEGLPQQKYVFTNAPRDHAQRVLSALRIENHFAGIFDINFIEYESKPALSAYRKVLSALRARPDECLMIDDSLRNLVPAQQLGMRTVLLDGKGANGAHEGADHVISTIYEVRSLI